MPDPYEVRAGEAGCAERAAELLRGDGFAVVRDALDRDQIRGWASEVERAYARLESLVAEHGIWRAGEELPAGTRYQASVAALGVDAVPGWESVAASLHPVVWDAARGVLGGEFVFGLDICWLRRQYPPSMRAPGHGPHQFHQDGAYGLNFLDSAQSRRPLLPIIVAWIPFVDAGLDSPGLEFVTDGPRDVLTLDELRGERIDTAWPEGHRLRPVVAFGDVVLLAGQVLHRTWATDEMTAVRTCAELRMVPPEEAAGRLAGHRMLDFGFWR
ncbi:MAG: phytanoyl-CoA dioxygenase family protein [Dehalococcoidia bacterium]|nr:phytanoyl-CoA dioxygenase family protein [Dehalococcoidia bacterium]